MDKPTETARRREPPIYNEPAEFDEAECEARGRADRLAGVNPIDCPYVAGFPVYAWERGYFADVTDAE